MGSARWGKGLFFGVHPHTRPERRRKPSSVDRPLWCRGYGVVVRASGTVTFLFTDIEGSTRLWEESPELIRAALTQHDEAVRKVFEASGGTVLRRVVMGLGVRTRMCV